MYITLSTESTSCFISPDLYGNQSPLHSHHFTHASSSSSSSLLPYITPLFYSRLKTYLFHKPLCWSYQISWTAFIDSRLYFWLLMPNGINGDRLFASVGPKLWNSLPDDITLASSLSVFRKKLKTHLFRLSYPDVILQFAMVFCRHRGPWS